MKKITAILLTAILMLAGLTACGGSSAGNDAQAAHTACQDCSPNIL